MAFDIHVFLERISIRVWGAALLLLLVLSLPGHARDALGVSLEPKGHRTFGIECMTCHTTSSWTELKKGIAFDHKLTDYVLYGKHRSVSCQGCHADVRFSDLKTDCAFCHTDHHKGKFGDQCGDCHTPNGWRAPTKEVARHQLTRFPLLGAHELVDCFQCHVNHDENEFVNTPSDCYSCHRDDYKQASQPDHRQGGFDRDCSTCHTMSSLSWTGSFTHPFASFMQTPAHKALECADCHTAGYAGTPQDCYSCHVNDYDRVREPNHRAGKFDHDCTTCHAPSQWRPATFDHARTRFPLQGQHAATPCTDCHTGGRYSALPVDCWSCHEKDYSRTTFPNHVRGQFSQDCQSCHTFTAWQPAAFNHDDTNFRLTGAHERTACQKCHVNGQYKGMPLECQGCHETDFQHTSQPKHELVGFTKQCEECHNTKAWQPVETMPAAVNHDKTRFPLIGKHMSVPCGECHVNKVFGGTSMDCYACHDNDFNTARNPNHAAGAFSHDCLGCHTMDGWKPATFDHSSTAFPLVGKHADTPCADCHVGGDYQISYTDCFQCHQQDYAGAVNPNHEAGQFSHACAPCHTTSSWKPSTFEHGKTKFPLGGAHKSLACQECHRNGNYSNMQLDCWSCHEGDFRGASEPDHVRSAFPRDCTVCHTTAAWEPASFDHDATRFPLQGAHGRTDCQECHAGGKYAGTPLDCWSCHQNNYSSVQEPNHVQGQFNRDCTICHGFESWKPTRLDHEKTGFPLTGKHRTVDCEKCHLNGTYGVALPKDCYNCHREDFNKVSEPNHQQGQFPRDCSICHSTTGWEPSTFDHTTTKFPLEGAHVQEPCQSCHVNGDYNLGYSDCFQCHENDYNEAQTPNHLVAQFDHDCSTCHSAFTWTPATFKHDQTKFSLKGAHQAEPCQSCHVNGDYNLAYTNCFQCHEPDFNRARNPDHAAAQFTHECQDCHNVVAWIPSTFDHARTKFPLKGAHRAELCQGCHVSGDYTLSYTDCFQCHEPDFDGTKNPDHTAGQFDHDCLTCHTEFQWKPATFDHGGTNFPLEGAHVKEPCQSCHVNGNYNLVYTDCFQCHEKDYTSVQNPDHVSGSFSRTCTVCHSPQAWKPARVDHDKTNFPLTGKHRSLDCENCHVGGDYTLTYTNCKQCHEQDFNSVKDPDHAAGKFSSNCETCHSTNSWKPATFDHASTKFPLEGAHKTVDCQDCHVNGNYQLTYTDCFQCHENDFNNVRSPGHAAGQFDHDCTRCHTMFAWTPSTLDHASTNFPLTGAHTTTPCQDCHTNGNYNLAYADCWQCHESTFNQTQNPDHQSGRLPRDCTQCHTTTSWNPSTFSHGTTNFPLQGAHQAVPCQDCHTGGDYNLSYSECRQCHETTFNNTTNPNHAALQFSRDCLSCHTQDGWSPASYDHNLTKFPLQGAHASAPCQDCHVGGNYQLAYNDCYQCHAANYNNASNPNHAANNFPKDCESCHSQNAWTPATFDHSTTKFPLTGAHQAQPCGACHINGNYNLTYSDCYQCHQGDYNGTTNPDHKASQFSHDCSQCHSTNAWKPATFDHNNTNFPLQGAHVSLQCADCHINGDYNLKYTDCYQCHSSDYNGATSPADHGAMNLDHDCSVCHSQSAWDPASTFRNDHNVNAPQGFPIYTGAKHKYGDEWNKCDECHTTNNTAAYCCTTCHEHSDAAKLADKHKDEPGYSYSCTSCTASGCHPDGREP